MKLFISLSILMAIHFVGAELNVVNQELSKQNSQLPFKSAAIIDEVVVQSSLTIKPKQQRPQQRRVRKSILSELNIIKRQVGEYGQSQADANAAAFQNYNNLDNFGNSAANSEAQAFSIQGPKGGFGASDAGFLTQTFNGNVYNIQESASASHALNFNLPNGKTVNFGSTSSIPNDQHINNANSRANAVSVNSI